MKRLLFAVLLAVIVWPQAICGAGQPPTPDLYQSEPTSASISSSPMVLLVMGRDHKMFYQGYNDITDLDGDGHLDIGFNPKITYYGYFDSNKCYKYNSGSDNKGSTDTSNVGVNRNMYFVPAHLTSSESGTKKSSADSVASGKFKGERRTVTPSAHGICNDNTWHGNWLNYMTMSRMDTMRAILYGGTRIIDTKAKTLLDPALLPWDAHVWGKEVPADNLWPDYSEYYDIGDYTPLTKPNAGTRHAFIRASLKQGNYGFAGGSKSQGSFSTIDQSYPFDTNPLLRYTLNARGDWRVWAWTVWESPLPKDSMLPNGAGTTVYNLVSRVQVCVPGLLEENCHEYFGSGGSTYKPTGILQEYGAGGRMHFGLMSGSYSLNLSGGVLRQPIHNIDMEIDGSTGIIKARIDVDSINNWAVPTEFKGASGGGSVPFNSTGIIRSIDRLDIRGWAGGNYYPTCTWIDTNPLTVDAVNAVANQRCASWGNPLGEMLYEGVRYFAVKKDGKDSGGNTINNSSTREASAKFYYPRASGVSTTELDMGVPLPVLKSWASPFTANSELTRPECTVGAILLLGDIESSYDMDGLPGSPYADASKSGTNDLKLTRGGTVEPFNTATILEEMTKNEVKSDADFATREYYVGQSSSTINDGSCSAKKFTTWAEMRGLCPIEPTKGGGWGLAAVAHYAHTHDVAADVDGDQLLDIYAVALSAPNPDLTFKISDTQVINFQPFAKTFLPPANGKVQKYAPTCTLLNYFITDRYTERTVNSWKFRDHSKNLSTGTNAGDGGYVYPVVDDKGNFLRGAILVNFEDVEQGADHDMDALAYYFFSIVTDKKPSDAGAAARDEVKDVTGALGVQGKSYWKISSPEDLENAKSAGATIGLWIRSSSDGGSGGYRQHMGYIVTGSNKRDGTYLEVADDDFAGGDVCSPYNTPRWCDVPKKVTSLNLNLSNRNTSCFDSVGGNTYVNPLGHASTVGRDPAYKCGDMVALDQERFFAFRDKSSTDKPAQYLKNPMWYAAKYGGFNDKNGDGMPDSISEWDADLDGDPDTYFFVASPLALKKQLESAFQAILRSVERGTATSAKVNNVLGGGVASQTFYFPEQTTTSSPTLTVQWAGLAYGLFVDPWGNLRENTVNYAPRPNDGIDLDLITNDKCDNTATGDCIIAFESSSGGMKMQRYTNPTGDGKAKLPDSTVNELKDLKTAWNVVAQLAAISDPTISRSNYASASTPPQRLVYSNIYPVNANGEVTGIAAGGVVPARFSAADSALFQNALMAAQSPAGFVKIASVGSVGDSNYIAMFARKNDHTNTSLSRIRIVPNASPAATDKYSSSIGPDGSGGQELLVTHYTKFGSMNIYDLKEHLNKAPANSYITAYYDGGSELVAKATLVSASTYTFPTVEDATKRLINYTLGQDQPGMRSRQYRLKDGGPDITWRLGDVINSRPMIAGAPISNYDLIYSSLSYARYKRAVAQRRQVAYFGSNDGILHAINVGFYGSVMNGKVGYRLKNDDARKLRWDSSTLAYVDSGAKGTPSHALGAEIWGYIPQSILPHLQWLPAIDYKHSYFVDLTPKIVDIQNGPAKLGDIEPYEWRTILIGGLRLGGRTITVDHTTTPPEVYYSEYFALDITDPEQEPKLLWRFSHRNLGMTTSDPAVVRGGTTGDSWYVVLGSGPIMDGAVETLLGSQVAYEGISNQQARIFVINAWTGKNELSASKPVDQAIVVGKNNNVVFNGSDKFSSADPPNNGGAFIGDMVTINAPNFEKRAFGNNAWANPVVYIPVTARWKEKRSSKDVNVDGGAILRLRTVDTNGKGLPPSDWVLSTFMDVGDAVTGAVNVAQDCTGQIWLYFGAGRLWATFDNDPCETSCITDDSVCKTCKIEHERQFYGAKEPGADKTVKQADLLSTLGIKVQLNGALSGDGITATSYDQYVNNMTDMGTGYAGFKVPLGIKLDAANKRVTADPYEMVLSQPKIVDMRNCTAYVAFTTHVPSVNQCLSRGKGYMYILDAFTGLVSPNLKIDSNWFDNKPDTAFINEEKLMMGDGVPSEVALVSTADGAKVSASSQEGDEVSVQFNFPANQGLKSWNEVLDMVLDLTD